MAKQPTEKEKNVSDETLPESQGEKEKPPKPGKSSAAQNRADRA